MVNEGFDIVVVGSRIEGLFAHVDKTLEVNGLNGGFANNLLLNGIDDSCYLINSHYKSFLSFVESRRLDLVDGDSEDGVNILEYLLKKVVHPKATLLLKQVLESICTDITRANQLAGVIA